MDVRIVHINGCSATPKTISLIDKVANDLGLRINLENVVVNTPEEAAKYRHVGSPTVQVNGLDIDPEARKVDQFGLT